MRKIFIAGCEYGERFYITEEVDETKTNEEIQNMAQDHCRGYGAECIGWADITNISEDDNGGDIVWLYTQSSDGQNIKYKFYSHGTLDEFQKYAILLCYVIETNFVKVRKG